MPIDKLDIQRQDDKQVEERRDDIRRDRNKVSPDKNFQVQYQSALLSRNNKEQAKDTKDVKGSKEDPKEAKEKGDWLSRIVGQVKAKPDESRQEQGKNHLPKKEKDKQVDDDKKDKVTAEGSDKSQTVSEEGYQRVASQDSPEQQSDQGSQQGDSHGGDSGGDGSQGGDSHTGSSFSGGGGSSFGGGSFSGSSGQGSSKDSSGFSGYQSPFVSVTAQSQGGMGERHQGSSKRELTQELMDQMVSTVSLRANEAGEKTMELTLSDSAFSGLRFKVAQSPSGLIITFICPQRVIKNSLIIKRLDLYSRFKEKGIVVSRIDIEDL